MEGIDPSEFGCIYSPAERRGPAPRNTAMANDSSSKSESSRDDCCDNVKSVEFPLSTGNDGILNNSTEQRDPIFVSVSSNISSTQQTSSRVNGISEVQPPLIHHVHIDPTESTKKPNYSQYHRISLKSWIVKAIHSIRINTNGQYCENNNITSHTSSRYLESALQIASSLTNQIVQAEEKYGPTGEEVEMLSLPPVSVGRDWAAYVTVQLKDVVPGSGNSGDLEDSKTTAAVSSFASHGGNDNDWVNTHVEVDLEEKKEIAAAAAVPSLTSNVLKGGNNSHLEEEKEIAAAAPSLTSNDSSKPKAEQLQDIDGHDLTLLYQALGGETDAPHENHGRLDDNDLNKELDSFLQSIEREVSPPTNIGEEAIMQSPFDATNSDEVDAELTALYQSAGMSGEETGGDDNFENTAAQGYPSGINPTNVDLNYLDIDSAEIQCPTGNLLNKNDNVVNENLRRIYYLGLVFYELFTGGEIPSDDLFTLPTCENAFVSLSHLTLLNKNNEDDMSIGDTNKHHQGQSSSNFRLCESSCEYLRLMGITGPICDLIFNMLDSVHGYLSGNESYTNMAQVARDDEVMSSANDHKFWKIMHGINSAGVNTTEIKLNCMNEETVVSLVSDLLCVSPRLVGSLSSVLFSRSKGNVLFFLQLLLLLYRDGLLYLDLGCQRWKWDEDKIVSLKLPDNIAICLSNGICKLSMEIQLALNTLSMFGASAKLSYLKLLESNLHMKIIEPLKEAEAEGLVTNTKGSFKFCHDRIQEASLNLIEEQYRRINHLAYGKCLAQKASEANDVDLLFIAVHQINFGGPSAVTEHRDYFDMANHNLAAGKQAMSMAEFTSASSFLSMAFHFFVAVIGKIIMLSAWR